jgi:hypothetical protein
MTSTFRAILTHPVDDDGVAFDVEGLEAAPIREDLEYGGVRVRTQATMRRHRTCGRCNGPTHPMQHIVLVKDVESGGPISRVSELNGVARPI